MHCLPRFPQRWHLARLSYNATARTLAFTQSRDSPMQSLPPGFFMLSPYSHIPVPLATLRLWQPLNCSPFPIFIISRMQHKWNCTVCSHLGLGVLPRMIPWASVQDAGSTNSWFLFTAESCSMARTHSSSAVHSLKHIWIVSSLGL